MAGNWKKVLRSKCFAETMKAEPQSEGVCGREGAGQRQENGEGRANFRMEKREDRDDGRARAEEEAPRKRGAERHNVGKAHGDPGDKSQVEGRRGSEGGHIKDTQNSED